MSKHNNPRIPNTLEECTYTGATVSNLNHYAQQLEMWGKRLLIILIVVGIIFTIVETVGLIDVNEELIIPTLISSLLSRSIYAVIEFFAYHVLAMLIRALAAITANTTITANVALWEASKKESSVVEVVPEHQQATQTADKPVKRTTPVINADNSWICPNCGQGNLNTRSSCWRCDHQK